MRGAHHAGRAHAAGVVRVGGYEVPLGLGVAQHQLVHLGAKAGRPARARAESSAAGTRWGDAAALSARSGPCASGQRGETNEVACALPPPHGRVAVLLAQPQKLTPAPPPSTPRSAPPLAPTRRRPANEPCSVLAFAATRGLPLGPRQRFIPLASACLGSAHWAAARPACRLRSAGPRAPAARVLSQQCTPSYCNAKRVPRRARQPPASTRDAGV